MAKGWIKLHRKTLESPIWKNPNTWRLFSWMLLKASHKPTEVVIGTQRVKLNEGQLIFGRKKASAQTGLSEQQIRTAVSTMISHEINQQTTNKYSIVTILNWDVYQNEKTGSNQHINQQTTSKQPANNQQTTTYKNVKNEKNAKKVVRADRASHDSATADRGAGDNGTGHPLRPHEPKPEGWDAAEDLMRRWVGPRFNTGGNYLGVLDAFWQECELVNWLANPAQFAREALESAIGAGSTPSNPKAAQGYLGAILQRCDSEQCMPGESSGKTLVKQTADQLADQKREEFKDI